ncbi:hypothetical protein STEG23_030355 [Scotinomys teguina]
MRGTDARARVRMLGEAFKDDGDDDGDDAGSDEDGPEAVCGVMKIVVMVMIMVKRWRYDDDGDEDDDDGSGDHDEGGDDGTCLLQEWKYALTFTSADHWSGISRDTPPQAVAFGPHLVSCSLSYQPEQSMMAILRPIGQVEAPKRGPDICPPHCYCSEGVSIADGEYTHIEDASFPLEEDDE